MCDSPLLRAATNEDAESIRELVFAVLAEYGLAPDPAGTDADIEDLEASYWKRGGAFYALETTEGAIVGCFGLYAENESTCELRKMYLCAEQRGRGLGKLLMERAISEAKARGFRRMTLETASVLKEAISLYRSCGFRPFEPQHLSGRCDQALALDL